MLGDTVLLAWFSFLGTLLWPFNPDAALLLYVGGRGHPMEIGIAVSLAAQLAMLLLLQFVGHHIRRWWRWLDRKCAVVEHRWGARLAARTPIVAATSGFLGIPPGSATVLMAAALELPARRVWPIFVVCRLIWLLVLARVGHAFA
jgi:hypothetical protein